MGVSDQVRERLRQEGHPFAANDSIAEHLRPGELEQLQAEVEDKVAALLHVLVIDQDHNTKGTAGRLAKMFLHETMRGRFHRMPEITDFPNAKELDQVYTVGPVTVRSMCSHHMVPIMGRAWMGVIPNGRVVGLSKFNRIVEWVMARPQIQEEATVQLADLLEELLKPKGLALVVRASHLCMTWRGVKDAGTEMVTSVMRGPFRENAAARAEFLSLSGAGQ